MLPRKRCRVFGDEHDVDCTEIAAAPSPTALAQRARHDIKRQLYTRHLTTVQNGLAHGAARGKAKFSDNEQARMMFLYWLIEALAEKNLTLDKDNHTGKITIKPRREAALVVATSRERIKTYEVFKHEARFQAVHHQIGAGDTLFRTQNQVDTYWKNFKKTLSKRKKFTNGQLNGEAQLQTALGDAIYGVRS
jgi:hypothetical protein